ncbi:hypothetical protein LABF186_00830 [Lactobacillus amylovorus subsp. animalium]|uniref:NERD domain-containing protein n=1 Tax=Lactobacillus amylovorus subsp. animalium TaxID=3378536 RepID=A0ABD0BZQ1_LACAM|nr:hypothetical protein LABF186_00830 [Lactobacillus amylovorus]GMM16062.1 hypothetical protein LABF125_11960 [Lactobacillus amylovorus]
MLKYGIYSAQARGMAGFVTAKLENGVKEAVKDALKKAEK